MPHSLGDGIAAANAAHEDDRRAAIDFIETYRLREGDRLPLLMRAVAILLADDAMKMETASGGRMPASRYVTSTVSLIGGLATEELMRD